MIHKRIYSRRPVQRARSKPKNVPVISLTGIPPQAKQTWWSQRFIEVLESFKMGSRLARGKAYAEEAKVLKLSISSGIVNATVQGSKKAHYKINIRLEPLSDMAWKQVMQNLTKKAVYAVELLQDKMPKNIEDVFVNSRVNLFPAKLEDLDSNCDCPDWSNPCKHIAAVYYILAQHFDLDPFLIFVWRGRTKTQLLDFLRGHWKQGKPKTQTFTRLPIRTISDEDYDRYWRGLRTQSNVMQLDPFSEAVPVSGIKRLGVAPVQLDEQDLGTILAENYASTSEAIRDWIMNGDGKMKIVG